MHESRAVVPFHVHFVEATLLYEENGKILGGLNSGFGPLPMLKRAVSRRHRHRRQLPLSLHCVGIMHSSRDSSAPPPPFLHLQQTSKALQ